MIAATYARKSTSHPRCHALTDKIQRVSVELVDGIPKVKQGPELAIVSLKRSALRVGALLAQAEADHLPLDAEYLLAGYLREEISIFFFRHLWWLPGGCHRLSNFPDFMAKCVMLLVPPG